MSHTPTLLAHSSKYLFLVDWVATESIRRALFEFDLSLFFWWVTMISWHMSQRVTSLTTHQVTLCPIISEGRNATQHDVTGWNAARRLKKTMGNFHRCDMDPQNYTGMSLREVPGVKFAKWGGWVASVLVKVGSGLLSMERQWVVTLSMVGVCC